VRRVALAVGNLFFKVRDAVFPVVFFALALTGEPRLFLGSVGWDRVLDGVGVAVALLGQTLRAAVIGFAYIRRGGLNKRIHADALVQEGLFAHSRNPLYLGNFLALLGFTLIVNAPLVYLVGVPFFALAYLCIVIAEEDFLRRRFGVGYDAYCRRVPRFLLRLRGLRGTLAGMSFDWKRLVRKEYGATVAGLATILFLLAWQELQRRGLPAAQGAIDTSLVLMIPVAAFYVTARVLKKTGKLGSGAAEAQ
jgi:protein-S-isoprenylcysteine O-methyltransferase Ste14